MRWRKPGLAVFLVSLMLVFCVFYDYPALVRAQEGEEFALWFGSEQDEPDWIQFQFPDNFPYTASLIRDLLSTRGWRPSQPERTLQQDQKYLETEYTYLFARVNKFTAQRGLSREISVDVRPFLRVFGKYGVLRLPVTVFFPASKLQHNIPPAYVTQNIHRGYKPGFLGVDLLFPTSGVVSTIPILHINYGITFRDLLRPLWLSGAVIFLLFIGIGLVAWLAPLEIARGGILGGRRVGPKARARLLGIVGTLGLIGVASLVWLYAHFVPSQILVFAAPELHGLSREITADLLLLALLWLFWSGVLVGFYRIEKAGGGTEWTILEYYGGGMKQFALILLPIVAVRGLFDYGVAARLGRETVSAPLLAFGVILVLLLFYPKLVVSAMRAHPLRDKKVLEEIREIALKTDIDVGDVRVLEVITGRMARAMITGFLHKRIFLTDYMLSHLDPEERQGVLLHEIGHLKKWHPLLKVALQILGIGLAIVFALVLGYWDLFGSTPFGGWVVALAFLLIYNARLVEVLSNRFDRAADDYVLEKGGDPRVWIRTLKRLGELNAARTRTWRGKIVALPPASFRQRIRRIAVKSGISREELREILEKG
ncbi:MAG: M48 family metalloprotease [Syntrophothermus sp.]